MASPGLQFLMISSFLLSIVSVSTDPDKDKVSTETKKVILVEKVKALGKYIVKNIDAFRTSVTPFLSLIPVWGPLTSAILNIAVQGAGLTIKELIKKEIKNEFESLQSQLAGYQVEHKWDTWASGAYHKPEMQIELAWTNYQNLIGGLFEETDKNKKKALTDVFFDSYKRDSTSKLHFYLTKEGTTLSENLATVLATKLKCHEKDIREYTVFISSLFYKGNYMNQLYDEHKNTKSKISIDKLSKQAYESALAMFQMHKNCIFNNIDYIIKEVEELIDHKLKRQEQANKVRYFLEETYNRFDWMVVAFITKSSQHKIIETLNKHLVSRFTEVTKDGVSVAVARQVKGTHTKAGEVKEAIKKCVEKSVLCYKVPETLEHCEEYVETLLVSQTYTVVHTFTRKAHDSHQAIEAPDDIPDADEYPVDSESDGTDNTTPYIYTGQCFKSPGVKGGKSVVLIKSDEEIMTKNPCSKLDCGTDERGKCVSTENIFVAMCKCKYPYFGEHCKESLENLEKEVFEETTTLPK